MKINPKQLERLAKRMGIQATQIDAEEVIIKTPNKDIVIKNPQVSKINMMGQETFQVTGDVEEREKEKFTEEDIELVSEQAGVSLEDARKALEETNDIAEAILKLKK
ncbi:MAG TPA: nascent polypeptide-associated complex protein [Candidatus Aenigmarchaeota archaeon]|nr:nascent polypeptide-associated complex protein [Candidatus Aenigmarchaeota archaeon]